MVTSAVLGARGVSFMFLLLVSCEWRSWQPGASGGLSPGVWGVLPGLAVGPSSW